MVLRQNYEKGEFRDRFQDTLLFSAIEAGAYIDWEEIRDQVEVFENQLERLESLKKKSDEEFKAELESLLKGGLGEKPMYRLCFRLLGVGKSKDDFVVRDGIWKTETGELVEMSEYGAEGLSEALIEAGIGDMVQGDYDIKSLLTGIEVGLESHSRKNRQGNMYEKLLAQELEQIQRVLRRKGFSVELVDQHKIDYQESSGSKTVDFALLYRGRPAIVFEANCYSAQGSKPSEIKRSYENVARKMEAEGIEYVWVTDGYAWKSSLGSILDAAFESHPNLYNIHMVQEELEEDILSFLSDEQRASFQENSDPQSRLTDMDFEEH